jgi:hypothetical protein
LRNKESLILQLDMGVRIVLTNKFKLIPAYWQQTSP